MTFVEPESKTCGVIIDTHCHLVSQKYPPMEQVRKESLELGVGHCITQGSRFVVEKIASLRGMDWEEVAAATTRNACGFFRLPMQ